VIADRAREEDAVAGLRTAEGRAHAPDAGGGDEQAVGATALDHLGVAGDDSDTGRLGCARHRPRDAAEIIQWETLLDHEACAEPHRLGPCHGEVVDGSVDGQLADVAAREEERLDHERIGGEREPVGDGRIAELVEHRVGELFHEEALDEPSRRLATRAVGERDQIAGARHATRRP
jgi:hypothetical protein